MAWCLVRHRDRVALGCMRTEMVALGADMGDTADCSIRFEPAATGLSGVHLSGDTCGMTSMWGCGGRLYGQQCKTVQ
jgi:hypothetical protein